METHACPNCATGTIEVFYRANGIPVHSCVMCADRTSAVAFPTRDLALGFCGRCGFVSNVLFDPSVQEYASGYEEQQSFSPRFRAFQTELIGRLVERYDLRGKDVIEIGCGKGDFLIELCQAGGNRGVGIDPACVPERMAGRGDGRVRFVPDYYSERYADLPCDFLCCRHTLEHIHSTNEFVGLMRRVVGDRSDLVVFFEVPAIERVLEEAAFWDIYYEHCSYFGLGSLARLFRANRFEVVELGIDFDDQYSLIVAHPADDVTAARLPSEDDLGRLAAAVGAFRDRVRVKIHDWRSRITRYRAEGKRLAIWGSGSKCVSFLSTLSAADDVDVVVDVNPYRQGKWLAGSGKQVTAPDTLRDSPPDVVIVMNPVYCHEIQRDLDTMGISAELMPV